MEFFENLELWNWKWPEQNDGILPLLKMDPYRLDQATFLFENQGGREHWDEAVISGKIPIGTKFFFLFPDLGSFWAYFLHLNLFWFRFQDWFATFKGIEKIVQKGINSEIRKLYSLFLESYLIIDIRKSVANWFGSIIRQTNATWFCRLQWMLQGKCKFAHARCIRRRVCFTTFSGHSLATVFFVFSFCNPVHLKIWIDTEQRTAWIMRRILLTSFSGIF